MRLPSFVAALFCAALLAVPAGAMTASQHLRHSARASWSARGTLTFFRNRPWLVHAGPARRRAVARAAIVRAHARLELAARERARATARLAAAAASRARASHYAGWMCIHAGRGPNTPHEGDGTSPNGRYSGPLQMTSPWEGYSVDWNAAPMGEVFAIADRVAARNGYSWSWMHGQWPQTFPPCAGFFD